MHAELGKHRDWNAKYLVNTLTDYTRPNDHMWDRTGFSKTDGNYFVPFFFFFFFFLAPLVSSQRVSPARFRGEFIPECVMGFTVPGHGALLTLTSYRFI